MRGKAPALSGRRRADVNKAYKKHQKRERGVSAAMAKCLDVDQFRHALYERGMMIVTLPKCGAGTMHEVADWLLAEVKRADPGDPDNAAVERQMVRAVAAFLRSIDPSDFDPYA